MSHMMKMITLMEGKDIALTHSTFSHADDETLNSLSKGNYCLFLDEALDIIVTEQNNSI